MQKSSADSLKTGGTAQNGMPSESVLPAANIFGRQKSNAALLKIFLPHPSACSGKAALSSALTLQSGHPGKAGCVFVKMIHDPPGGENGGESPGTVLCAWQ
jgi:hypothetical protein